MGRLSFEGRVAIITGAGGGLGRAYAKCLAQRGCKIVVNDLGGSMSGLDNKRTPSTADAVVAEIRALGGEATADYHNVAHEGHLIVATALHTYGRIDIVINNAGILRDRTLLKQADADMTALLDVHVGGAFGVTHAAWPHLVRQGYGRVVLTGSAAGIYGNYGQTAYGAAKYGLAGMTRSLAREGAPKNIGVNYIAPVAASRITASVLPKAMLERLGAELVAPIVAWLCHEACAENGGCFEVGAGRLARLDYERSGGLQLALAAPGDDAGRQAAALLAHWERVVAFEPASVTRPKHVTDVDWVGLVQAGLKREGPGPREVQRTVVSLRGRTAIVTGAGGGLGRAYALALAAAGCAVLVNDVSSGGVRGGPRPADLVVQQIRAAGGVASASYADIVEAAEAVVEQCRAAYGRVDIVINNAGILRDRSFLKMTRTDFEAVLAVHLLASVRLSKAVLPLMKKQRHGRLLFTTSAVALYGNFGQVNYGTAKAAVLGFARSLALETAAMDGDIRVNTIAPNAGTAMTATVLPSDIVQLLKPEYVAPLVLVLSSDQCPVHGGLFEVGSGWQAALRVRRSPWRAFEESALRDDLVTRWPLLTAMSGPCEYPSGIESSLHGVLQETPLEAAKQSPSDHQQGQGKAGKLEQQSEEEQEGTVQAEASSSSSEEASVLVESEFSYGVRDVLLYHVGLGMMDVTYTYEREPGFKVSPAFAVLIGMHNLLPPSFFSEGQVPAWMTRLLPASFNPMLLLHGGQRLCFHGPSPVLPTHGSLRSRSRLLHVSNKPSGVVLALAVDSFLHGHTKPLVTNECVLFLRGIQLAKSLGLASSSMGNVLAKAWTSQDDGAKELTVLEHRVPLDLAKLYRLSGDLNPLHIDVQVAQMAGFSKPILHGLCSFGIAVTRLANHFEVCKEQQEQQQQHQPSLVIREFNGRFVKHVFPGETLLIKFRPLPGEQQHEEKDVSKKKKKKKKVYKVAVFVKERDQIVLDYAYCILQTPQ